MSPFQLLARKEKEMTEETAPKKKRGRPKKTQPTPEPTGVTEASTAVLEDPEQDLFTNSSIRATGAIAIKPVAFEEEEKFTIWMGVSMKCPYECVHAGGVDFPRFNEIVTRDEETNITHREKVRGKIVNLTKNEIEVIAKAVGRKIMRKNGARQWVMNADGEKFSYRKEDDPLGEYLFMQVVGDSMHPNWRQTEPQMMA